MQSPIPLGTVLQNRYRLGQELGQGGFGRTYLAEDLGRFNEKCVIKEFVPIQGEEKFSEKATQLFQREAAILYQIKHPQIPQFRATFEQDQRLFLVQDYVAGKTYRDLLNRHRVEGTVFSESEARQFLQQILPVLAHIHAKGIIHRDISPENIIQRQNDHLPVLIDFGVVKEAVTRIQAPETDTQATSVGKLGYAPSEQVQSGRAYPNSDLYSLAVTAIVLLTGMEPQQLFDDINLTWNWREYANVSPGFAQVLNKALSYRPGDRYQSVSEMSQALGAAVPSPMPKTAPPPPDDLPVSQANPPDAGGRYEPPSPPAAPLSPTTIPVPKPAPPPKQPDNDLVKESPWAAAAVGLGLALAAGIGGWALVRTIQTGSLDRRVPLITRNPEQRPEQPEQPSEQPPGAETPPPNVDPAVAPESVEYAQQFDLDVGESKSVEGSLKAGEAINYQIQAEQGQTLGAVLTGEGVLLTVLAPSGDLADPGAQRVQGWQGPLATSGQFVVQLSPVPGLAQSNYQLNLSLADRIDAVRSPESTPSEPESTDPEVDPQNPELEDPAADPLQPDADPPEPVATLEEPEVAISLEEQQVQFAEGRDGIQLADNNVGPDQVQRYVVNAREGQILSVRLSNLSGPATLNVYQPDGKLIEDAFKVLFWEGYLPVGGDFWVEVSSPRSSDFTLDIRVKN
ncbi:MAG: serine/threonine-protein kinase [Leptolyngbyaceae cyanobacterium MO_188.B28]|nr:serine/threonine-protein kinase [Leptolyngbyaceae cyanobacterium MO_188.B28]